MHVFSEGCRHPLFDLCEDNPKLNDVNATSLADWWCKRCDPRIDLQKARIFQRLTQLVPQNARSLTAYYAQEAKLVLSAHEIYVVPDFDLAIWDEPPTYDIDNALARVAEDLTLKESKLPLFVNYGLSRMVNDSSGTSEIDFHAGSLPVVIKGPISRAKQAVIDNCTMSRYITARNIAKMVSEGESIKQPIFCANDGQSSTQKSQAGNMSPLEQTHCPMELS